MKTAEKAVIVLGMIAGFYTILPIILTFVALNNMKKDQMTTGWKAATLCL